MSDLDQGKLIAACRKLVALVDGREPGLSIWHKMCADTVDELRRVLADDCNEPAPVGNARCCRGRGHEGNHCASPTEGWAQKGSSRT